MKYFIIAGEASGDLHGSYLVRALQKADPRAQFRFWGGAKMARAIGREPEMHIDRLSIMGVWEVLKHLSDLRIQFKQCKASLLEFRPDALILIDFPGFNLRIAEWASKKGFNIQYYISPKLWAWNKKRVKAIKKYVDDLYVILPFEADFYRPYGIEAHYVGNPLVEEIKEHLHACPERITRQKPIIALLPGSRAQEVRRILPTLLDITGHYPDYHFVLAAIRTVPEAFYRSILDRHPNGTSVEVLYDATYPILQSARIGLIASGTSTLEAALMDLPQVVCYKTSPLTYFLAKTFLNIRYISLVNLIMDAPVVPELIQNQLHPGRLRQEVDALLADQTRRKQQKIYRELSQKLGNHSSSTLVAEGVLHSIRSRRASN